MRLELCQDILTGRRDLTTQSALHVFPPVRRQRDSLKRYASPLELLLDSGGPAPHTGLLGSLARSGKPFRL